VVIDAVKLAVSEALTNVVVHAYVDHGPGPMIVEASIDGHGHLVVLVCDEGVGMVPRTDSPGMGVGISLMAQMADDVSVANRHDAPGAIVSLCFALDDSRSPTRNDSFLSNGSPTDDRSSPVSTCDDRGD
jgi:serine/threonine-protein kinase RsbW/stage II sporulation protein AB (anti-sigma F factor)